MASRKALCVGINVLKNFSDATLNGCLNDVKGLSKILTKHLGFAECDIKTLLNEQATKSNIMSSLHDLITEARAGEISHLVFSFSGFGTQVPDISGDEPGRADEVFCPYDLAQVADEWDPSYLITDEELTHLLLQLPPSVLAEVFLDTCHSGKGLKEVDFLMDRKPRFLPPPTLGAFNEIERLSLHGMPQQFARHLRHQMLWAACRADSTSAESRIGGMWQGAFTHFLCKEIHENQNRLSRRELLQRVRIQLAAHRYSQIPQLECPTAARDKTIAAPEIILAAHA